MAQRREEYEVAGVRYPTRDHARLVSPAFVAATCRISARVPAGYFVATARHESGFAANEVDTEPSGFVSWGLFQISDEEARAIRLPGARAMLDPVAACVAMVRLAERHLDDLEHLLGRAAPRPDAWAYLSVWHNQGARAARATVAAHGCRWGDPGILPALDAPGTYRRRNHDASASDPAKAAWFAKVFRYGDDCALGA